MRIFMYEINFFKQKLTKTCGWDQDSKNKPNCFKLNNQKEVLFFYFKLKKHIIKDEIGFFFN